MFPKILAVISALLFISCESKTLRNRSIKVHYHPNYATTSINDQIIKYDSTYKTYSTQQTFLVHSISDVIRDQHEIGRKAILKAMEESKIEPELNDTLTLIFDTSTKFKFLSSSLNSLSNLFPNSNIKIGDESFLFPNQSIRSEMPVGNSNFIETKYFPFKLFTDSIEYQCVTREHVQDGRDVKCRSMKIPNPHFSKSNSYYDWYKNGQFIINSIKYGNATDDINNISNFLSPKSNNDSINLAHYQWKNSINQTIWNKMISDSLPKIINSSFGRESQEELYFNGNKSIEEILPLLKMESNNNEIFNFSNSWENHFNEYIDSRLYFY